MVNISIDVTDLGGEARPGDKVVFWRPRVGGSATHAGRVISTAPHTVVLEDGTATVPDVEPGEMRVLLQCRGVESQGPIPVTVPDGTGTVTLRSLIESQFEYAPPIVSAVQEAASNASASEEAAIRAQVRSEAAADRAEDRVDDAINNGANLIRAEVKQDADRAVSARQAATQSETKAKTSEDAAASSASNAATSETNAKQSETNAGDYAAVATTAATEAVDAMEAAARSAASFSIYTGIGSPEGKIAAPVGAVYTDSAATNGAIRWIKTSGTGNTGWRVEYGDTGARSLPRPDLFTGGIFRVSRSGDYVQLVIHAATLTSTLPAWQSFMTLPPGFRTATSFRAQAQDAYLDVVADGRLAQISTNVPAGKIVSLGVVYRTNDSWPTSLPGTPN